MPAPTNSEYTHVRVRAGQGRAGQGRAGQGILVPTLLEAVEAELAFDSSQRSRN